MHVTEHACLMVHTSDLHLAALPTDSFLLPRPIFNKYLPSYECESNTESFSPSAYKPLESCLILVAQSRGTPPLLSPPK